MTVLMVLLTLAYFAVSVLWLIGVSIPFEAFLWAGLILIFGWWAHDTIRERRGRVVA